MDLRLAMMGLLAASGGVLLGTLLQVGKTALAEGSVETQRAALAVAPEAGSPVQRAALGAPELHDVAHGVNRLARETGARLHVRDCGAPPCLVHLSWTDDRDLRSQAQLEQALHAMGWRVRGQSTVVEAPGDGRWFSHYAAVIWPASLAPGDAEESAQLERVRNVLRAAVR